MTSFASKAFSHHGYAAFRPSYPNHLYSLIFSFHNGPSSLALDLGTGHGLVARYLSPHFDRVIGSDPSAGMIQEAKNLSSEYTNISFHQASAERSDFVNDNSVDLVVAAQASHWFNYDSLWPELKRIVRPGGTLAFWGYKDHVMVSHPKATALINHYAYDHDPWLMGSYWQQPGRSIVQQKLRAVQPPPQDWNDITRLEYEPETGEGTRFMQAKMKLGTMEEYIRTWSAFHAWKGRWPNRKRRAVDGDGEGDVIDELMDRIREEEPELRGEGVEGGWREVEVDIEWGSALIMARKKQ
ncbi:hypothetical protein ASPWEDRAFT_138417 [Aspergillus wentii DTO 134E9]|uniref:Methyltransferase type 11 domain-containing protein n=1 Tax=Aspergillus wentii DTO 134E9 TaxID=1073089 RepID=A0A1L9REW7_ASPWE|nr:uncharacterized protein ASPWEDRAFT_138417 [Aspergillus wentii DTO 134E9]KAI9933665.1 hypothetical protein MW887_008138 [Aspergillus wentii]OJJ33418.1 hypothetical protein ASPWEDRAFT_138417 [Aspergillus wentii DTO 134E9]